MLSNMSRGTGGGRRGTIVSSVLVLAAGSLRAAPVLPADDVTRLELGIEVQDARPEYSTGPRSGIVPVIRLERPRYYWHTTAIGYHLLGGATPDGHWTIAAELALPADGLDVDGERHLVGLVDREPTLEGGLRFERRASRGTVAVGARADLEGEHGGVRVHLHYERPVRFGGLVIAPSLFVTWRDRRNGDYYYGVDEHEARAGRAVHELDEPSVTPGLGYTATYAFGDGPSVFHTLEIRALDAAIGASPLTVNGTPFAASVGIVFRVL